jgi:hypothetical protein
MEGKWLSILEYASSRNKSISTVRRYIKANRVKFKEENGKYYIWAKQISAIQTNSRDELELKFEVERLKKENRILIEEMEELRMLVSLYEGQQKMSHKKLPDLPVEI